MFKLNTVQIGAAVGVKRKGRGAGGENLNQFQVLLEILVLNSHRWRGRGEVQKSHLCSEGCFSSICWAV